MKNAMPWINENAVLVGALAFTIIVAIVGLAVGYSMKASGASIKPLLFVLGLIGIVAVPQLVVHLIDAQLSKRIPTQNKSDVQYESALEPISTLSFEEAVVAVSKGGSTLPYDRDPVSVFPELLEKSSQSRLIFTDTGSTRMVAEFSNGEDAVEAFNRYGTDLGLNPTYGNLSDGIMASRGSSDFVYYVVKGTLLISVSGMSEESIEHARLALSLGGDSKSEASGYSFAARRRITQNAKIIAPLGIVMLVAAVAWFFKGSIWATELSPDASLGQVAIDELRNRILSLKTDDKPLFVELRQDGRVALRWDVADSRWQGFASLHSVKEVHQLIIELDDRNKVARVTEYWSRYTGYVGEGGGAFEWKLSRGMRFFDKKVEKAWVRSLPSEEGEANALGIESRDFSYDIYALKAPVIEAILDSGWVWRPLMWGEAPNCLRWLTE